MNTKKINVKKLISYLLIFTVFFTTVQMGNVKKANATEVSQVTGLALYAGEDTVKHSIVVDKDQNGTSGKYVCEFLDMVQSFTLSPEAGYTINSVTSSNSSKMSIDKVAGTNYKISNIKDYSDFTITIVIQKTGEAAISYDIKMSFEANTSLEFGTLVVTYDNQSSSTLKYADVDPNSGNYTLDIDSSLKKATIELFDANNISMQASTYTVNGSSNKTVDLIGGDNTIIITRTYQNTSRSYKLIITKKGEAKLKSLTPTTGTLTPAFASDTYDYKVTVPTTQTTIAFTPTSVDNSSTIKVNGITVKSGNKSPNIKLDEGDNDVQIELTTKDGDSSTYTVNVTRTALFRSAQLTGITLTSGSLSPAFNKGIYEYTGIVDNSVSSIGITPTAEDSAATITVNGKTIPSGATSPYVNLDEGGNVINVKVTDTKGNSNIYVLNITRRYSKNNVNLSGLSVTDGTMSPTFDPETYAYSVKVARNIEKVRISFSSQNDKAKVKINGIDYTNGKQSDYIKIDIGANLAVVEVTAEDGKTTTTYKLSIIRGDIEGTNQWVLVAGEWTFYNAAGIQIKNQWVKYDNQWYFLDINGYRQTGWLSESGKWYYLNTDGIMQTGWFYDKGYWYYLQGDGSMRTDYWATYDGKWYYFNNFGEMQTGWAMYKGRYYYMDDKGVMQKGWITYDKNKYYINDDGSMRTGWLYSGKVWFYLDGSGKMLRGWQIIDGKRYYFDANGAMKTGMMFLDGQWINLNNV